MRHQRFSFYGLRQADEGGDTDLICVFADLVHKHKVGGFTSKYPQLITPYQELDPR